MAGKLDLDVASPDKVSQVLYNAAEVYYESAVELESAWGEKAAGRPWVAIARIMERASQQVDNALKRVGY